MGTRPVLRDAGGAIVKIFLRTKQQVKADIAASDPLERVSLFLELDGIAAEDNGNINYARGIVAAMTQLHIFYENHWPEYKKAKEVVVKLQELNSLLSVYDE